MNVGKSVRTVANAQSRAVHNICLNTGSAYAAHAAEAYDLFLTAAVGDGIALWDLRSNRLALCCVIPAAGSFLSRR